MVGTARPPRLCPPYGTYSGFGGLIVLGLASGGFAGRAPWIAGTDTGGVTPIDT